MPFKTEKQIESLLLPVTRNITLQGGHHREFTMMKIYWDSFDYILNRFATLGSLIQATRGTAEIYRIDLDTALAYNVARLYRWGKDDLNVKVPFEPPVCPLSHLPSIPPDFR